MTPEETLLAAADFIDQLEGVGIMTPEEILLAAADVIDQRGWCQGRFGDETGAVCAMGAICCVAPWQSSEAQELLLAEIGCGDIALWNDAPERTKEDVTRTMRKAAHHDT